jgi:hypothetical protein
MPDDGTTIGVWIGNDDGVLTEFDDALECGPEHAGSRSAEVKEAMQLATAVEDTLDDLDYEFDAPPSKRHFVTQALLNQAQREAER